MSSSTIPPLVSPVRGTADLATMLRFVQDPKFQAEVKAYLTSMEAQRMKLNETIKNYGKAMELGNLLNEAKGKAGEAERVLREARDKAEDLIEETKGVIAEQRAENTAEKEKLSNLRRLLNKDEKSLDDSMTLREDEVEKKLEEVAAREETTNRHMENADTLIERYNKAIKKLQDVGFKV